jgi:hypothetical protein
MQACIKSLTWFGSGETNRIRWNHDRLEMMRMGRRNCSPHTCSSTACNPVIQIQHHLTMEYTIRSAYVQHHASFEHDIENNIVQNFAASFP